MLRYIVFIVLISFYTNARAAPSWFGANPFSYVGNSDPSGGSSTGDLDFSGLKTSFIAPGINSTTSGGWKSTGIQAVSGQAVSFQKDLNKGITINPYVYLVEYRADYRFDYPAVFIYTCNTSGTSCTPDYSSYSGLSSTTASSNTVSVLNNYFAMQSRGIPIYTGDLVNITYPNLTSSIIDIGAASVSATSSNVNLLELNTKAGYYTDNTIFNMTADEFCRNNTTLITSSSFSNYCVLGSNSLYQYKIQTSTTSALYNIVGGISPLSNYSIPSCNSSTTTYYSFLNPIIAAITSSSSSLYLGAVDNLIRNYLLLGGTFSNIRSTYTSLSSKPSSISQTSYPYLYQLANGSTSTDSTLQTTAQSTTLNYCLQDQGLGLEVDVGTTVVKTEKVPFVPIVTSGVTNYVYSFTSPGDGLLGFRNTATINSGATYPFDSFDARLSATSAISTPYSSFISNYNKMNGFNFGRYLLEVRVGRGNEYLSGTLSNLTYKYYIQPSGGSSPTSSTTGTTLPGFGQFEAPSSGTIWVKVTSDDTNLTGNVYMKVQSYTGSQILSKGLNDYVIQPILSQFAAMMRLIYDGPTGLINNYTLIKAVKTAAILYVVIFAIYFLFGQVKITVEELVSRIVKITLTVNILFSSESWEFFNTYLFDSILNGTNYFILVFTGQDAANMTPFTFLDPVFNTYTSTAFWGSILTQLVQLWNGLTFMAIITVMGVGVFLTAVFEVVMTYVLAFVSIYVLIGIAPIFIPLMLFSATSDFFYKWIQTLVKSMLVPVVFIILILTFDTFIHQVLNSTVVSNHWGCLKYFSIHVDIGGKDFSLLDNNSNFCLPFFIPDVTDSYNTSSQSLLNNLQNATATDLEATAMATTQSSTSAGTGNDALAILETSAAIVTSNLSSLAGTAFVGYMTVIRAAFLYFTYAIVAKKLLGITEQIVGQITGIQASVFAPAVSSMESDAQKGASFAYNKSAEALSKAGEALNKRIDSMKESNSAAMRGFGRALGGMMDTAKKVGGAGKGLYNLGKGAVNLMRPSYDDDILQRPGRFYKGMKNTAKAAAWTVKKTAQAAKMAVQAGAKAAGFALKAAPIVGRVGLGIGTLGMSELAAWGIRRKINSRFKDEYQKKYADQDILVGMSEQEREIFNKMSGREKEMERMKIFKEGRKAYIQDRWKDYSLSRFTFRGQAERNFRSKYEGAFENMHTAAGRAKLRDAAKFHADDNTALKFLSRNLTWSGRNEAKFRERNKDKFGDLSTVQGIKDLREASKFYANDRTLLNSIARRVTWSGRDEKRFRSENKNKFSDLHTIKGMEAFKDAAKFYAGDRTVMKNLSRLFTQTGRDEAKFRNENKDKFSDLYTIKGMQQLRSAAKGFAAGKAEYRSLGRYGQGYFDKNKSKFADTSEGRGSLIQKAREYSAKVSKDRMAEFKKDPKGFIGSLLTEKIFGKNFENSRKALSSKCDGKTLDSMSPARIIGQAAGDSRSAFQLKVSTNTSRVISSLKNVASTLPRFVPRASIVNNNISRTNAANPEGLVKSLSGILGNNKSVSGSKNISNILNVVRGVGGAKGVIQMLRSSEGQAKFQSSLGTLGDNKGVSGSKNISNILSVVRSVGGIGKFVQMLRSSEGRAKIESLVNAKFGRDEDYSRNDFNRLLTAKNVSKGISDSLSIVKSAGGFKATIGMLRSNEGRAKLESLVNTKFDKGNEDPLKAAINALLPGKKGEKLHALIEAGGSGGTKAVLKTAKGMLVSSRDKAGSNADFVANVGTGAVKGVMSGAGSIAKLSISGTSALAKGIISKTENVGGRGIVGSGKVLSKGISKSGTFLSRNISDIGLAVNRAVSRADPSPKSITSRIGSVAGGTVAKSGTVVGSVVGKTGAATGWTIRKTGAATDLAIRKTGVVTDWTIRKAGALTGSVVSKTGAVGALAVDKGGAMIGRTVSKVGDSLGKAVLKGGDAASKSIFRSAAEMSQGGKAGVVFGGALATVGGAVKAISFTAGSGLKIGSAVAGTGLRVGSSLAGRAVKVGSAVAGRAVKDGSAVAGRAVKAGAVITGAGVRASTRTTGALIKASAKTADASIKSTFNLGSASIKSGFIATGIVLNPVSSFRKLGQKLKQSSVLPSFQDAKTQLSRKYEKEIIDSYGQKVGKNQARKDILSGKFNVYAEVDGRLAKMSKGDIMNEAAKLAWSENRAAISKGMDRGAIKGAMTKYAGEVGRDFVQHAEDQRRLGGQILSKGLQNAKGAALEGLSSAKSAALQGLDNAVVGSFKGAVLADKFIDTVLTAQITTGVKLLGVLGGYVLDSIAGPPPGLSAKEIEKWQERRRNTLGGDLYDIFAFSAKSQLELIPGLDTKIAAASLVSPVAGAYMMYRASKGLSDTPQSKTMTLGLISPPVGLAYGAYQAYNSLTKKDLTRPIDPNKSTKAFQLGDETYVLQSSAKSEPVLVRTTPDGRQNGPAIMLKEGKNTLSLGDQSVTINVASNKDLLGKVSYSTGIEYKNPSYQLKTPEAGVFNYGPKIGGMTMPNTINIGGQERSVLSAYGKRLDDGLMGKATLSHTNIAGKTSIITEHAFRKVLPDIRGAALDMQEKRQRRLAQGMLKEMTDTSAKAKERQRAEERVKMQEKASQQLSALDTRSRAAIDQNRADAALRAKERQRAEERVKMQEKASQQLSALDTRSRAAIDQNRADAALRAKERQRAEERVKMQEKASQQLSALDTRSRAAIDRNREERAERGNAATKIQGALRSHAIKAAKLRDAARVAQASEQRHLAARQKVYDADEALERAQERARALGINVKKFSEEFRSPDIGNSVGSWIKSLREDINVTKAKEDLRSAMIDSEKARKELKKLQLELAPAKEKVKEAPPAKQPSATEKAASIRSAPSALNRNSDEFTQDFFKAAYRGDLKEIDNLLGRGANLFAQDKDGWTALTHAAVAGREDVIDHLAKKDNRFLEHFAQKGDGERLSVAEDALNKARISAGKNRINTKGVESILGNVVNGQRAAVNRQRVDEILQSRDKMVEKLNKHLEIAKEQGMDLDRIQELKRVAQSLEQAAKIASNTRRDLDAKTNDTSGGSTRSSTASNDLRNAANALEMTQKAFEEVKSMVVLSPRRSKANSSSPTVIEKQQGGLQSINEVDQGGAASSRTARQIIDKDKVLGVERIVSPTLQQKAPENDGATITTSRRDSISKTSEVADGGGAASISKTFVQQEATKAPLTREVNNTVSQPISRPDGQRVSEEPAPDNSTDKFSSKLFANATTGNLTEIQKLVDKGANIFARNDKGQTALHKAISAGNKDVVKYLLDRDIRLLDDKALKLAEDSKDIMKILKKYKKQDQG